MLVRQAGEPVAEVNPPTSKGVFHSDLRHDIDLLRSSGIRPLAIVRRLEEIEPYQSRVRQTGVRWTDFRVPARGISNYSIDSGNHVITLEFRKYAGQAAAEVCQALAKLKDDYRAITAIIMRCRPRPHINIHIPVRDLK